LEPEEVRADENDAGGERIGLDPSRDLLPERVEEFARHRAENEATVHAASIHAAPAPHSLTARAPAL
jgi:hypothetical protein